LIRRLVRGGRQERLDPRSRQRPFVRDQAVRYEAIAIPSPAAQFVDVSVGAGRVSTAGRPIVVSADVGPDLIVPWRRPSLVILYARHAIDPPDLGLTDAQGRHDPNVIVRTPEDRSVFPVPALVGQIQGNEVPLADPLQQIWDLQDLGGADRIEAAGRLREWLLERP
jgi:hypothetical protein